MSELKLLGKVLGTYDGWDEVDTLCVQFYDVVLNEAGQKLFGWNSPISTMGLDLTEGIMEVYDDQGTIYNNKNWDFG